MTIFVLPFLRLLAVASAVNPRLSALQTRQSTCIIPDSDQEKTWDTNCPKKNTVDGNGHCPVGTSQSVENSGCLSYCEAKVRWFFGLEVPYPETQCQANSTCTFATSQSVTVTNTYTFNLGLTIGAGGDEGAPEAAFDLGASYSWSKSVGTTKALTQPRPSNSLQYCGYWTFLPYYITSCGTSSMTATNHRYEYRYSVPFCDQSTYQINDTVCNNTPYTDSDGRADGVSVFVLTNCADNSRLPMSEQDARYAQAGVAQPNGS